MDAKKKVGPLPMWVWIVAGGAIVLYYLYSRNSSSSTNANATDPSTGLTYAQEAQMNAAGIDPLTGQSYAQEQYAATSGASGGGGVTDSGSGTTTGTATLDANSQAALSTLDGDIQNLSSQLAAAPYVDPNAYAPATPTFGQEIQDVVGGASALRAAGLLGTPAPPTATKTGHPAPRLSRGAVRAPFGATKPKAPSGYKAVGQGNGFWQFVPVVRHTVSHSSTGARFTPAPPHHAPPPHRNVHVSGKKKR